MPSVEDIFEMDAQIVYERVVESEPEAIYLLFNDMRDIINEGTFPKSAFYTVKTTDDVLRKLLDPSELFTDKYETN